MLEKLEIRHYALIEDASIAFDDGLTVLTGETGAGKSIILGALSLLLGDKASGDVVRSGHDSATISGTFHFDHVPPILASCLASMEIELDDGDLVVGRTVRANGRSTCSVQGTARTRAELVALGKVLVDISAQREHQSLFQAAKQRDVLDDAGDDAGELAAWKEAWHALGALEDSYRKLQEMVASSKREADYLTYAVDEIEKVHVRPGEDAVIEREIATISSFEQIHEHVEQAVDLLQHEGGTSALDALRQATKETGGAAERDASLSSLSSRLESASIEVQDIYETLREYLDHMSFSQEKLDRLQNRDAWLRRLKKKYGPTLDDVVKYHDLAKAKLEAGVNGEEKLADLERSITQAREKLKAAGAALTTARKREAVRLGRKVETVLHDLGMPQAVFAIKVLPATAGPSGMDDVSFEICANPGMESRPISQIASGGELSRILLALTAVLKADDVPGTLVFDEIDAGIGGSVALSVGRELDHLKACHQVLAITHLASIAAMADNHLVVRKQVRDGMSYTSIVPVEGEDRVREIARMLSGDASEVTLMHARQLLKN